MRSQIFKIVALLFITKVSYSQWSNTTDNSSTGSLSIGALADNSYSSFTINGPNIPIGANSKRDIIFNFSAAGKSYIRSYRGGSWDTYLQFLTTASDNTSGVRLHIDGVGNVGIGTTSPTVKLHVNGALRVDGTSGGSVGTGNGSRIELSTGGVTSIEENWGINLIGNDGSPVKVRNAALLVGYTSSSAGWGTGGNLLVQGNVGIGTTSPDSKLTVSGQVHAQEVKVTVNAPGPDYVFEKDYKLTSLDEIKNYIDQNKHLPEVPSAKEMEKNGVLLGEMNMLLLKKIEELTLYVIELKTEVNELRKNQGPKK